MGPFGQGAPSSFMAEGDILFAPQSGGWIYAHGAAGGDVAGGEGDEEEERACGGEGEQVAGLYVEKHELRGSDGGELRGEREADGNSDHREDKGPQEDGTQQRAGRGSQGDAYAEFARALRDGVGHDSIYSDGGEEHRQKAERGEQKYDEAAIRLAAGDGAREGRDVRDGQVLIEALYREGGGMGQRAGVYGGADHDSHRGNRHLRHGNVDLAHIGLLEGELLQVPHDADDLQQRMRRVFDMDGPANDGFVAIEGSRHRLVHDGDGSRSGGILWREIAAMEQARAYGAEVARHDHVQRG